MKKYKKWDQMTDKEKIEFLKYRYDTPEFPAISFWVITIILMTFIALVTVIMVMFSFTIGYVYDKLNLNMTDALQQPELISTLHSLDVPIQVVRWLVIIPFVFILLWIYQVRKNNKKHKEFLKSIEVKSK